MPPKEDNVGSEPFLPLIPLIAFVVSRYSFLMPISNQPSGAIGTGANVGAVDDLPTDGDGMALRCQGPA